MKRLLAVAVSVTATLGFASSAQATIHPVMVGWVCGNASGDPPGQTPGETHSDQSTLRAVQSTGVVTITSSGPVVDTTVPASKFSTFDVATETGTPSNAGALNCAGG